MQDVPIPRCRQIIRAFATELPKAVRQGRISALKAHKATLEAMLMLKHVMQVTQREFRLVWFWAPCASYWMHIMMHADDASCCAHITRWMHTVHCASPRAPAPGLCGMLCVLCP